MQLSQLMQFLNSGPPLHGFTIGPKLLKFPFECHHDNLIFKIFYLTDEYKYVFIRDPVI